MLYRRESVGVHDFVADGLRALRTALVAASGALLTVGGADAALLVSPVRVWAVQTPPLPGDVVQYLVCNLAGAACVPIGVGAAAELGTPLVVDHRAYPSGTLRVRFCSALPSGAASTSCGPSSDPGPAFQLDPALAARSVIATPANSDWRSTSTSSSGVHVARFELPASAPANGRLRFQFLPASTGSVQVSLLLGTETLASFACGAGCSGPVELDVKPALLDALRVGEREIELRLAWSNRSGAIGTAQPGGASAALPHLALTLMPPFVDVDQDGIGRDGDFSGDYTDWPCVPGHWLACDDNCPYRANESQADRDLDGIGDTCDPVDDGTRDARDLAFGGAWTPASRNDCLLEWRLQMSPLPRNSLGHVPSALVCRDGDPACDLDGVPGRCTFGVGLCTNLNDARLILCRARNVLSLVLTSGTDPQAAANLAPLAGLRAAAPALTSRCGEFAPLVVNASPGGSAPLVLDARAVGFVTGVTSTQIETDRISLACAE